MKKLRPVMTWVALLAALITLGWAAQRFTSLKWIIWDDYVEYWAASHLNITQGNPYHPEQIGAVEYSLGRTKKIPLMMWNPPWTLAVMMPLALLPYPLSRLLWYLIGITILLTCASWLWQAHNGKRDRQWIAWLLTFSFAPVLHVLRMGQITPLLLLGVVGFWAALRKEKEWAAGAVAALALIKPHVLYLFLMAVVLWGFYRKRWGVLGGLALATGAATGLAWAVNPALINQYWVAINTYPPEAWVTPTLGGMLRLLFGAKYFWLQFLPSVFGTLWLIIYAWQWRTKWDWDKQLPIIVLVSITTTAYGWVFDQTPALVALIPLLGLFLDRDAWKSRPMGLAALAATYGAVNLIVAFTSMEQSWYWWMPTFMLLWFLTARRIRSNP